MTRTSITMLAAALFATLTMGVAEAGRASRLLNSGAASKAVFHGYQLRGKRFRGQRARRRSAGRKPDVIILDEPVIVRPGFCPNPQDQAPGC